MWKNRSFGQFQGLQPVPKEEKAAAKTLIAEAAVIFNGIDRQEGIVEH